MVPSRRGVVSQTDVEVLHLDLRALLLSVVHPRHVVIETLVEIHDVVDLLQFLLTYHVLSIFIHLLHILAFLSVRHIVLAACSVELSDLSFVGDGQILHVIQMGIAFARHLSLRIICHLRFISVIVHVEFLHN